MCGHGQRHNMEALSRVTSAAQVAQMCSRPKEVENNYAENIKGTAQRIIFRFSKIKKEEQTADGTALGHCCTQLFCLQGLSVGTRMGQPPHPSFTWAWGGTDISTRWARGWAAKPWLTQGALLPVSLCTQKQLHKSPPAH